MVCSQSGMFNKEKSGRPAGGSETEGSGSAAVTQPWAQGAFGRSSHRGNASVLMSRRGVRLFGGVHVLSITRFCISVYPFSSV